MEHEELTGERRAKLEKRAAKMKYDKKIDGQGQRESEMTGERQKDVLSDVQCILEAVALELFSSMVVTVRVTAMATFDCDCHRRGHR